MAHIKTYARIKPSCHLFEGFEISPKLLSVHVPELSHDYGSSPGKVRASIGYDFQFHHVFDINCTQDDIFDNVAKDIVEGFVNGYNGTIFAFGQTGSGKTFTMEGGSRSYRDRGIAPRVLSTIYKYLEQREDDDVTVEISYLEIYQEVAYDLLSSAALNTFSPVVPLPKISVVEGLEGLFVMRNLSLHIAANEQVAQCLLLQGQSNRKVAETPVNQRSSRSHGVVTIHLTCKAKGSDIIVRSKLHLVDLAGSERVSKTGVDGQQLSEAKSINLSLHHLETVIIALQADSIETGRQRLHISPSKRFYVSQSPNRSGCNDGPRGRHIPYRNSLLTMILRDSLGGNCLTAMIATVSLECQNLGESISTCRFAQRVACIANHVMRNEEVDDKTVIKQLRKKIAELESEVACLKLEQNSEIEQINSMNNKLTDEDKLVCSQVVQDYLAGRINDPVSSGIRTPYRFRECMKLLKRLVLNQELNNPETTDKRHYTGIKPSIPSKTTSVKQSEEKTSKTAWTIDSNNQTSDSTLYTAKKAPTAKPKEKTDPDLQTAVKSRLQSTYKYKSPFERKREKEIEKLTKSIKTIEERKWKGEIEIKEMKRDLTQKETEIKSLELRKQLEGVQQQINNQHNLIEELKNTDSEQIIQELLVQTQLQRKQAKLVGKLKSMKDAQEENIKDNKDEAVTTKEWGIEEKFGQYRKRDGSLNTRQVFDMLKEEEEKKKKAVYSVEKEKMITLSKQLELRETETRKKLKDLKEMLRLSKMSESVSSQKARSEPPPAQFTDDSRLSLTDLEDSTPKPYQNQKDLSSSSTHIISNFNENVHNVKKTPLNNHSKSLFQKSDSAGDSDGDHVSHTILKQTMERSMQNRTEPFEKPNTVIPSEYVHTSGSASNFDARKMGFSSTTFDAALTSMLDREIVCSDNFYNQFARPSRSKVKKQKKRSSMSHVQNNMDDATKMMMTWGSSSKNIPVSVRLDKLLGNVSQESTVSKNNYKSRNVNSKREAMISSGRTLSSSLIADRDNEHSPRDFTYETSIVSDTSDQPKSLLTMISPRSHNQNSQSQVRALSDEQCEISYLSKAQMEKNRISRIRKAQTSASVIQKAWRRFQLKNKP